MKYNVLTNLVAIDGTPMKRDPTENSPLAALRDILVQACIGMNPQKHPTGEEKYRAYDLAKTIHENDEVDLPAEDTAFLKALVGEAFSPVVVGAVWDLLDNGTPPMSGSSPAAPESLPELPDDDFDEFLPGQHPADIGG